MGAVKVIAIWGIVALLSAVIGGIVAGVRNRGHSSWAAWCFLMPPLLIVLIMLPVNKGPRPRRPTLDEESRDHEAV